jgi:hypothetical protein
MSGLKKGCKLNLATRDPNETEKRANTNGPNHTPLPLSHIVLLIGFRPNFMSVETNYS